MRQNFFSFRHVLATVSVVFFSSGAWAGAALPNETVQPRQFIALNKPHVQVTRPSVAQKPPIRFFPMNQMGGNAQRASEQRRTTLPARINTAPAPAAKAAPQEMSEAQAATLISLFE